MIYDVLSNSKRYENAIPGFKKAFEFLSEADLPSLPSGRQDIDGDRIYAVVSDLKGRGKESVRMEAHRKYVDIQFTVSGSDEIGWRCRASCGRPVGTYDAAQDIEFFKDEPALWVAMPAGTFAVFFPEDAHAPVCGSGNLRKIVVKVLA